jgi:hypothetical protein
MAPKSEKIDKFYVLKSQEKLFSLNFFDKKIQFILPMKDFEAPRDASSSPEKTSGFSKHEIYLFFLFLEPFCLNRIRIANTDLEIFWIRIQCGSRSETLV